MGLSTVMSRIRLSGMVARCVERTPCSRKTRMLVTTKHSRRSRTVTHAACRASPRPTSTSQPPGSAGSITKVPTTMQDDREDSSRTGST